MALPVILCSTSAIPIGPSPSSLSSEISLQVISKGDGDYSTSTNNFLINLANVLRKSNVVVRKEEKLKLCANYLDHDLMERIHLLLKSELSLLLTHPCHHMLWDE